MRVQALLLGEYDKVATFRLYRFATPLSPPSTLQSTKQQAVYYYCLEDLERLSIASLRDINMVKLYRDYPSAFWKDATKGYTYASTNVLHDLARRLRASLLADLCQLTEHTPSHQRQALLQRIPSLTTQPFYRKYLHLVEQELNPVPLNGQEWFLQPWAQCQQQQRPLMIRLSPPQDQSPPPPSTTAPPAQHRHHLLDSQTIQESTHAHSRTNQSSLLLQRRLAPKLGHHAPHLTINTPAYTDHHLHTIRSSPLRKAISKHQVQKRLQAMAAAAAAATSHQNKCRQHPLHHHHQQQQPLSPPSSSSPPLITTSHSPFSSVATSPSAMIPPPPPFSAMITQSQTMNFHKKQTFLQHFGYLYDSLEQTRVLKSTLDDTIRQSSACMTKIQEQHQASLSPQYVKGQVIEQMESWMTPFLDQLQQCMDRLTTLEEKVQLKKNHHQKSVRPIESNTTDRHDRRKELLDLMTRLHQLEKKVQAKNET